MCQGAETLNKPAVLINKHRLITNEIPLDCPDNYLITDNGMLTHSSLFLCAWNGNLTPQRKVLNYLLHVHTFSFNFIRHTKYNINIIEPILRTFLALNNTHDNSNDAYSYEKYNP